MNVKLKSTVVVCAGLVITCLTFIGCGATRVGYESASFMENSQDGAFSVRHYDPMVLVSADMQSEDTRGNSSFMKLFNYIDGNNDDQQKIAMTTPVFMHPDQRMSFVLPKENQDRPPQPSADDVTLENRAGFKAAVVRFNGRANKELIKTNTQNLREWMAKMKFTEADEPIVAQYDPPWTPGHMRKNEIIIPLQEEK